MISDNQDAMLRYHMAVVTGDKKLRREIKRVTAATNATAKFLDAPHKLESISDLDLVILDARKKAPAAKLLSSLPRDLTISYIVEGDTLFDRVNLLNDDRVDSILAREDHFDDDEFIASATKSLRHDIFGLHKYFPWGVTTFTMEIGSYQDKTDAISIIMEYAEASGMRGPVRERIQLACDELMMNALYHAPVDKHGGELYRDKTRKELAQMASVESIQVQYGCSGRYFGVSIRDYFGSLTRRKVYDYLSKVSDGVGADIESKTTGAGLGIVSVSQSVSKLIFNIIPGQSAEVIALFDTDLISRGKVGARSVHMFLIQPDQLAQSSTDLHTVDDLTAMPEVESMHDLNVKPRAPWMVVALLAALVCVLAFAFANRRGAPPAPEPPAKLSIAVDPADSLITVNGNPVDDDGSISLPRSDTYEIEIQKDGHQTWRKTVSASEVSEHLRLYVNLLPDE